MIPGEAVEAVARMLANEELFRAECEGYGWDAEKDSSDPFMPSARKEAKRYLEAAAPHLMAAAWDEGLEVGLVSGVRIDSAPDRNPYRKDGK